MADINQIKLPNGDTYNFKDTVSGYTKNNGTVTSVATGTGLTGGTITTSGTISIANHSADYISGGYLNIHPENAPTLIPFVNNDIAYLLKRGGSVIVKYDGTTRTVDLSNCFDASPSYWGINQSITTITIELTLHKVFGWTNTIYIDFGSAYWRAKGVKIEVMNTNYPQDVWTQKYNNTNNSLGHCYVSMSHTPVGAANARGGFNKIRFTLNPNQSDFRIAQIGVYNYGSSGLRETFLPKDGGSLIGSLTPQTNNTYNLGSSNYKWANGYFTNINGASVGSSPKFTDTTYESKAAASGGTAVSLCTTGEKYTWNNKSNLTLGTTATTALKGDTKYAGSSSAGGSATSAVKLDTATAGSATQPCYFTGGKPSACTYSLNKTVPADAKFTDTTYESKSASSGGTDLSLVTTGEKYTWNNKMNKKNPTGSGSFHFSSGDSSTIGEYAIAMGFDTEARGHSSSAIGTGLIAKNAYQHVIGKFNIEDPGSSNPGDVGTYAEIVGNGNSSSSRSNARTLDWDGNEVLAGGLKVNGTEDVATVDKLVKYFDLTANVQTADSGISPFSYYAQPEKTDANIHHILSVTVIDTKFNNPAIAVFYSVSGNTYKFMIYSVRTGNVKIRVVYN